MPSQPPPPVPTWVRLDPPSEDGIVEDAEEGAEAGGAGQDGTEDEEGAASVEEWAPDAPLPAMQQSASRETRTDVIPAYTELGAHAFRLHPDHKVDGSKVGVPTFGAATAGPFRFDSGTAVSRIRKTSDSSPRVVALFFDLKLLGLSGESVQGQSRSS